MHYSLSTVLMTILASNLLIILITFCFRQKKILLSVGYRLLAVFLLLTAIRFLFPFELPFTKSIYLPESFSKTLSSIRHPFYKFHNLKISIWFLIECVWFIGIVVNLVKHIRIHKKFANYIRFYGKDISNSEPVNSILSEICGKRKKPFRVISIPGLKIPQVTGIFVPKILLPEQMEITDKDLPYILQHETFHHYHHDLLKKEMVCLLCAAYWWNPACHVFQKQVNLILEMHVDDSLVQNNSSGTIDYLNTLVRLLEFSSNHANTAPAGVTVSAVGETESELTQRFHMMCYQHKRTDIFMLLPLLIMVISIYVCSYLVIIEPSYYIPMSEDADTFKTSEGFIAVPKEDGSYDLYFNNVLIENVPSLEYYREITVMPAK